MSNNTFLSTHTSRMQIYSPTENYGVKSYEGKNSEGLLYYVIGDHSDMKLEMETNLAYEKNLIEDEKSIISRDYECICKIANDTRIMQIKKRDEIYNNKKLYEQVMKEIEERKIRNTETLKSYGLDLQ